MSGNGRLRVLHVGKFYPPHSGGMETHLEDLCGGLKEFADVRIIVAGDERTTRDEVIADLPVTRVGTVATVASTPLCPGMAGLIRKSPADIVHLHHPNPMAVLAYLASGHPGRLVVTYHSDIVRQRVLGVVFRPFLFRAFDRSRAIIATSERYAETSDTLTRYADRCHVIPLGIDLRQYAGPPDGAVAAIRREHGDRIVLGVGRLIYYKGFEVLVRAMERVRGRLLVVGEGPLREALERLAAETGVADRVRFLGRVDDVAPFYWAADVFALSSIARSEAYGLVQLEAMACGTPIVNTNLDSGVPFVSPHGVTGLTVPPANVPELADAINFLLDNPDVRRQYGEVARERVRSEFGLDRMVDRTLRLYERVVGNRGEGAG